MSLTAVDRSPRADDLHTKVDAGRAFIAHGSGRALLAATAVALGARSLAGPAGWIDLIVLGLTLVVVGPYEWVIHRFLLHASPASARMRRLGLGRGHVEHHKDPTEIRWLMLCWFEALLFWALLGVQSLLLAVPLGQLTGASLVVTSTSLWLAASVALLHYEWTHLLVHTRYRCRSRYYKALQRHHRLHHFRNEHYWLGVTARSGDRLLRTMPDRSDVELSATARTLGSTRSTNGAGG